ncbi:hypothetical protein ACFFJN_11880, partial [Erwinia mallotivora]|uniref:hypothetical protein n=1 Tax=Erwinia mallotivora TaxID=69222 RepID=UPI0035EEC07C
LCEHTARNSGLTAVPNSRPFSDTPTCILRFIGYKTVMDDVRFSEKKVRFAEPLSSEDKYPEKGATDSLKSEPDCAGAMFRDDVDFVSCEELEHFLQWRSEQQKISDNSVHSDIPASALHNTPAQNLPPFDSTIPDHYDIPTLKPIKTIYDIPRKKPVSVLYDIPGKKPISTLYDIPVKKPIPVENNFAIKNNIDT